MHVCFVLTTPFVLNAFVAPTIPVLLRRGWQVTVLVNTCASAIATDIPQEVEIVHLDIARDISLLRDLRTLWVLIRIFRLRKFEIVHSITPKAGLLAMVAARIAGIRVRLHTFTGQVWATRRGPLRWLLRILDVVLARCATALLVDSPSQSNFLASENIAPLNRLNTLGRGSIAGVDTERFSPNPIWRQQIRNAIGVPASAVLLLYLGRMHAEKGIIELMRSYIRLAPQFERLHLLLVGPDEGALVPALALAHEFSDRVHVINLTPEPERYMAASDIFCLASHREGFGLSLIEAASAALPCVATRIYGVTDAVAEGVTGYLVPVHDQGAFADAIARLVERPELRMIMGQAARQRVKEDFSQKIMVQAWMDFYDLQILLST